MYVFSIIEETTFLNVVLSINQSRLAFLAHMDADLGVEYNNDSYPKPSPILILFFCYPFTYTTS
jgi:hypothetical protein